MDCEIEITYLEMHAGSEIRPLRQASRLVLGRVPEPCPELNRFFYLTVGAEWWWYSRLPWKRAQWMAWVDRPELETFIASRDGVPVGYFELENHAGPEVEVVSLGLLPSFVGRGLGPDLLHHALTSAFAQEPKRVWLATNTLDHPRALATYQAGGLRPYRRETRIENLPDRKPELWS